jgi:starch synthase
MKIRSIVYVAREYDALAGAGGMKDVAEGLCKAAAAAGIDTHIFIPYYRVIQEKSGINPSKTCEFSIPMNFVNEKRIEPVTVYTLKEHGVNIHLVKSRLYDYLTQGESILRSGIYQYTAEEAEALGRPELTGTGYYSFFAMNVLLVKATLVALDKIDIRPDVIHCHDGHTALLPVIAQASDENIVSSSFKYTPSVVTIHNAGWGYHQDVSDLDFASAVCGVPRSVIDGCLLNGSFNPFVAAGLFGAVFNTVSENYARELQETGEDWRTGWLGHTLFQYGVKIAGVTNGVDPEAFNSHKNGHLGLAAPFSPVHGDFKGKELCKQEMLRIFAEGDVSDRVKIHGSISGSKDTPVLTFIGRLDHQKGYYVMVEALHILFNHDRDVRIVGLGSGNSDIETQLKDFADTFKGRACFAIGYDTQLANKIYAGGDFFLVPSYFEPCGLTDFYAQLMGNVPIVHKVGGLVKTLDGKYGFSYLGGERELSDAIKRALAVYRKSGRRTLRKIQRDAVKNIHDNYTWEKILTKKYLPMYMKAIEKQKQALTCVGVHDLHPSAINLIRKVEGQETCLRNQTVLAIKKHRTQELKCIARV